MKGIRILYFSAVGSTRIAAEILAELLDRRIGEGSARHPRPSVSISSIEEDGAQAIAAEAGFLVLCYPTYYLKPAPPMSAFAAGLGPFDHLLPCYLVTTCELYSENSARRLARILATRGLAAVGWKALRAPGSDVTAVLPAALVPWLYRFGRGFEAGLSAAADEIVAAAEDAVTNADPPQKKRPAAGKLPLPRWYTPLTQLLQVIALNHFDRFRFRLRTLDGRCTRCGLCAEGCPTSAISMEAGGIQFEAEQCTLCCRCVHGCPERAIVLRERLKDNRRVDAALLDGLKARVRASLGLAPQSEVTEREGAAKRRKP